MKSVIVKALEQGNFIFAHDVICIWYNIEKKSAISPTSILWLVPSHGDGYLANVSSELCMLDRDSQAALVSLTQTANRFLGTSVSVRGTPSDDLYIPERFGVPSHLESSNFRLALESTYFPSEIKAFILDNSNQIKRQIILPSKPHPIQALQLAVLGTTWPLAASFSLPLPDSKIHKVAIWSTGNLMGQQFELDLIQIIFENHGAVVEIFTNNGLNEKTFSQVYADPDYDILWVISHGEYDHFSPKNATISLDHEHQVSVDELFEIPTKRTHRRLLVMNICDGATHPGEGALPRIGFAATLASDSQATISHKWPVASIPAAMFGVVLAFHLSRKTCFFDAYKSAIDDLRNSTHNLDFNEELIDLIRNACPSFIDRLSQNYDLLKSFEHYASAAFFE
jgi:hypothetical protein